MPSAALRLRLVSKMPEPDTSEEQFKNYWERFAAHLEQLRRSPLTVKNYRSDLNAFWQWLKTSGHGLPILSKVSSRELMQYQKFLLTQKLKPNSVNRRMGALKAFYTWLQQTDGLVSNPSLYMPDPVKGVSIERPVPLSQEEQQNLVAAVQQGQNQRDIAIVKLLLYTGIRTGELCGLQWADIEIGTEQGLLLVRQPKSYRDRRLVLPPEVCAALIDLGYQAQAGSQSPVFIGQRGSITSRGVQDVLRKYGQRAGLKKLTPHTLRYTYAATLIEQGVDSTMLAELMGASPTLLLSYYDKSLAEK
jgi:site-specific recombinase XerD